MLAEEIEAMRNNFAHFTFGIARRALQKLRGHPVGMNVACFADVIKEELHAL